MLITERKFLNFNFANIYFADEPLTITSPNYDAVTYHTYKNWGDIPGYEKNECFTTIIDLRQNCDAIWKKINRQHKRHIQRAEKIDINVTINKNHENFHQIYKQFLKQKGHLDPFGLKIVSSQFIQKYGILFIAENKGELIGGNYYIHDKNNALLIDSAYKIRENTVENKKQSTDINCFLHWEAMQYFKNMGIINYDFGDVSCNDININHRMGGGEYFKRSFGGDVISRYTYIKCNSRLNKILFHIWNLFNDNSF